MDIITKLTGDYFAARLETDNLRRDSHECVDVRAKHSESGLLHIWVGPINLSFHVTDWDIICDAVNAAIRNTVAKV